MIVTDVTCYGDLYCVAGWDVQADKMIRPEPSTANLKAEASRFWGAQAAPGAVFSVGNVVKFDAADPPLTFCFPHATEDKILVAGQQIQKLRTISHAQIAKAVAAGVSGSLQAVFNGGLVRANSGKAYVR